MVEVLTHHKDLFLITIKFYLEEILKLIGIDTNSFAIAGSFIIFFLAIEMVLGVDLFKNDEPDTASVVPLAFPMIAGAGTLTSLLSLRAEFHVVNIIIAIVLNIIRKVFGVVLLAIAVKLFTTNIKQIF